MARRLDRQHLLYRNPAEDNRVIMEVYAIHDRIDVGHCDEDHLRVICCYGGHRLDELVRSASWQVGSSQPTVLLSDLIRECVREASQRTPRIPDLGPCDMFGKGFPPVRAA